MNNLEKDFVLALLSEQQRPDGRSFDQMRKLELVFGHEYGNVEVRLGKTRLVVQVSASVKLPRPERPSEGLFHITTDISSMASPQFENNRRSTSEEVLVARMIEKAIRRSNALDLESLCIDAGKRCWMVRADVHYLDYDGGLVDASCIGVIAGLLHFRRPDTSIDGDQVIVHDISERPPVPLSVLHAPISVSWSLIPLPANEELPEDKMEDDAFDGDDDMQFTAFSPRRVAVLDAMATEQSLATGSITITVNKDREVCQITKAGGAPLSTATLLKFTDDAHKIATRVANQISKGLEEDFKLRNRGNLGADLASHERASE